MPRTAPVSLLASAALALSVALAGTGVSTRAAAAAPPQGGQTAQKPHPKVEAGQDCETCHRDKTPLVVERWEKGPHGQNSVKCFVCHGTAGDAAFTTRPAMAKCDACHSEQVATMAAPVMKDKTCFTCHDPHALNPHIAAQGGKK